MVINNRKVFDAHFHIGTWGTQKLFGEKVQPLIPAWNNYYTPGQEHNSAKDLLNYFDRYDISGGLVVCNYLANDPKLSIIDFNKAVLEAADTIDRLYAGIFVSPLQSDFEYTSEALQLLDHPKVKVVKFTSTHWSTFNIDPSTWNGQTRQNMETILAAAKERDLILQFHTGGLNSEPLYFRNFLKEFGKDFIVYMVHSGESVYPGMQYFTLLRDWLDRGYRVYSDTSMAPGFVISKLLHTLHRDEIDHLLFATDSPWSNFMAEYAKIEDQDIGDSLKDRIFYSNALKLYGLTE